MPQLKARAERSRCPQPGSLVDGQDGGGRPVRQLPGISDSPCLQVEWSRSPRTALHKKSVQTLALGNTMTRQVEPQTPRNGKIGFDGISAGGTDTIHVRHKKG